MTNEAYKEFKEKYSLKLNEQQEQAVQAVDGATLLLAVPGSGKTTVLVSRLGYMVLYKGISPNNILAVTYTKAATIDMRSRFASMFGEELSKEIEFRTINGISDIIIRYHAKKYNRTPFTLLSEENRKNAILRDVLIKTQKEYPTDNDITEAETTIAYIKNMMLSDKEIKELKTKLSDIDKVYKLYKETLLRMKLMDYDDQLVYALSILQNYPDILDDFQERFRYICVDEAQDTAKIQHKIIQLLAKKNNNIFMVGDEDQSIYGFRAAYPQALTDFGKEYPRSRILYMEKNYRSTIDIIGKAATFISKNANRYNKQIIASKGPGKAVQLISVKDRAEQFGRLVEDLKEADRETAILYRDNDSSVPLVDLLLRNNVPFQMSRNKALFFTNKIVTDAQAFLRLALNPYDTDAFMQIYYKCGYYFSKKIAEAACQLVKKEKVTIFTALAEQTYNCPWLKEDVRNFKREIGKISKVNTTLALDQIFNLYETYMDKNFLDYGKFELLEILALSEPSPANFLRRINWLHEFYTSSKQSEDSVIKLSTVHSAKGLEYDSVYLIDVYDEMFPAVNVSNPRMSKEDKDLYQEERRLFYVAMTRAKNTLSLINIRKKSSCFIDELFPENIPPSRKKP